MKLIKGIYQASNVTFDSLNIRAQSYNWWTFVKQFSGKVVFNEHAYSTTTQRHQYKVRQLMKELNVKIDIVCETRASLDDDQWTKLAIENYHEQIDKLQVLIDRPRSKHKNNLERRAQITELQIRIQKLRKL